MTTNVLSTMVIKLVGDLSDISEKLNQTSSMVTETGRKVQSAGASLTAGITLPLTAASGAAFKFANDFNSGMANVASLGSEAAAAVEGWGPMVQDLAIDVGKSTDDMTAGLYTTVSAFGVANDTIEVLEANARAAAAGLATTEEAIALTSAITKAYNDTSAEAVQHAADLALRTVQLGQTTFPELASSIGRVAPLASEMGVSLEELFGVMATGTGVTGTAAEVSTQLRGIIQSLMAPTGDMAKLFEDMGVESGKAFLEMHGLEDGVANIIAYAEEAGTPLQKFIGSIEGQTLALALSGAQAETWAEKTAAMFDAAGATDEAFAAQTEGLNAAGFAADQAAVKMQVMAERVGNVLARAFLEVQPHMDRVIGFIESLVEKFTALDQETQNTILMWAGVAAAIGPVLAIVGTVIVMVGSLIGAWGTVTAALATVGTAFTAVTALLTGPVLLAIGAVVAVVALFAVAWSENWGGIQEKVTGVWYNHILPTLTALRDWFQMTAIPAIQEFHRVWTSETWPQIQQTTATIWANLQVIFAEIGRWIRVNLGPWVREYAERWATDWNNMKIGAAAVWDFLKPVFEEIGVWFNKTLPDASAFLAEHFQINFGAIQVSINDAKAAIDLIKDAAVGFWNWITTNTFEFKFKIPDLPAWATPGSPIPLHTAWKDFDNDLKRMTFSPAINAAPLGGAAGAPPARAAAPITVDLRGATVYGMDDLEALIMDVVDKAAREAAIR